MTPNYPTEDNHFKAHFNPWIGIGLVVFGLIVCFLTLQAILSSGVFSFRILIGIIMLAVGAMYLKRPYFAIAPNRLTVYNFFGQTVKRYPFASFNQIEVEKGSVYIQTTDIDRAGATAQTREPVKIRQWMTKSSDWQKLKRLSKTSVSIT